MMHCPSCRSEDFRITKGQGLPNGIGASKGARCRKCNTPWWLSKAEAARVGEPEPDTDPRQGRLL